MPDPKPVVAPTQPQSAPVRRRILDAAFAAFVEQGYAQTSTLDIATRAHVSKRELYSVVGNKQEMLVACITERARRMRLPIDLAVPDDRAALADLLTNFGAQLLREVGDPAVIAVFRLAIAEADRTPEIAQALDSIGREASRAALREMLQSARSSGLLNGDIAEMSQKFLALLWGDLLVNLLLRISKPPTRKEIQRRARNAATAFLKLFTSPEA
jgi:AcrR family transcriptional regulator